MEKEVVKHRPIHELTLGLTPLVLALLFLYLFIYLGSISIAIISFILTITFGLTAFVIHLFKEWRLSVMQFLFNIALVISLTLVIFAFAYTLHPQGENTMLVDGKATQLTFLQGFAFSVDVLTTLGLGDISPRGFFRLFTMIEVLMGMFYLGLFIAGVSHIYDRD